MTVERKKKRQSKKATQGNAGQEARQLTADQVAARASLPRLSEQEAKQVKVDRLAALESLDRLAKQIYDRGVRLQVPEMVDEAREGLP